MAAPRKLTERQQRFVEAYAASGNATDAARKAGYSDPNKGRQLVSKGNVGAAIAALAEKRKSAAISDRDERQTFLTKVQRGKMRNVDMKDRLKACELLSKMHGDFNDGPAVIIGSTGAVTVYVPANGRE